MTLASWWCQCSQSHAFSSRTQLDGAFKPSDAR